jgi:hypothetical protein
VGQGPSRLRGGSAHGKRPQSRLGDAARVLLALVRIFNGAAGLLAPQFLAGRLQAPEGAGPATHYPFRLFGVRTVIIGAELLSRDPQVRERAVRVALPIHATDTVSAALVGLRGELPRRTSVMLTAVSGMNTVLAWLARRNLP